MHNHHLPWLLISVAWTASCALDSGDGSNDFCETFEPGLYAVVDQRELGPQLGCFGLSGLIDIDPEDTLSGCNGAIVQSGCSVAIENDCVLGHGSHTRQSFDLRFDPASATFDGTLDVRIGVPPDFLDPSCQTSFEISLQRQVLVPR